ncbi:MAG: hypothetical protein JWQ98_1751 [Chlorobi bacterium]|nr:hypothetical protein [Chlorobiota bacterium]
MSYLSRLRLHFAGRFQAAPSTVNNDVTHYNNATFKPQYQLPGNANGWWNPRGNADWRLIGCTITSASRLDGTPVGHDDPVLGCVVADSDRAVPAKMVDLDPQQQLVSEIWGLEVRISDHRGRTLLSGEYETAGFIDIWDRAAGGGGDIGAGAAYQSILHTLHWGDIDGSPFLKELRDSARDGILSIKFNVDGYNMDMKSPEFTRGRVVGTIGPGRATEPKHFVRGRQFMAVASPSGNFFTPVGGINFCPAVVDESIGNITIDLGNALPTVTPGGPLVDSGTLSLAWQSTADDGTTTWSPICDIDYTGDGWYPRTAGVTELPADRVLTPEELTAIASAPLAILRTPSGGTATPATTEPASGLFLRADQFVFRLNPGERAETKLYATKFGAPYAGARVINVLDPGQLQGGPGEPPVATPAGALDFPVALTTDWNGMAPLPILGRDPGNPRGYVDGQVYGIRPMLEETVPPSAGYTFNQWDFISILLWNHFQPDEPPTWHGSLQPIFQQYANLYPVMDSFLNLADYPSVCRHRGLLLLAFSLDPENPNSMPVTRDLPNAKRRAILRWLKDVGPDGNPLLGTPPPVTLASGTPLSESAAPQPEADKIPAKPESEGLKFRGGKAMAAARRLSIISNSGND